MIDLITKGLPDTVTIGGEPFLIETDFRPWMRFCDEFEMWDQKQNLNVSYLFADEIPHISTAEDMQAIIGYAYPPAIRLPDRCGLYLQCIFATVRHRSDRNRDALA